MALGPDTGRQGRSGVLDPEVVCPQTNWSANDGRCSLRMERYDLEQEKKTHRRRSWDQGAFGFPIAERVGGDPQAMLPKMEDRNVTPAFVFGSSIIMCSLVIGTSISTSGATVGVAETAQPRGQTSIRGSFTLAQTQGMNRRGDRRDNRQDCRQGEGAVGADKRNCKQQGR